ncbi:hypothetical protein CYMTET_7589 [Cymbomonas tetramitiformis]|uniref:NADH-ubiquinone oxidoreductase ESSS subunit n=1 Tax=Cymbomonas tetramitiformis TaxID=36881 RepID=A0AAE0LHC5_9CHLO|nr:hypothetical protein CYMTET_7589 [Cymbomonas tetramitiformis]
MSMLGRVSVSAMRSLRARGGPSPPFWSEGNQAKPAGYLYGEAPLPAGQARKIEDWEPIWVGTFLATPIILYIGLNYKPNTSLMQWAHEEADRRSTEA